MTEIEQPRLHARRELPARVLGGYQFSFGVVGLFTVAELGSHLLANLPEAERPKALALFALMVAAFGGVALTGIGLIRGHPYAWICAVLCQLVQVPTWQLPGTAFSFVAGALLGFARTSNGFVPLLGLKSSFFVGWDSSVDTPYFGANLAPIIVLLLVLLVARVRPRDTQPRA